MIEVIFFGQLTDATGVSSIMVEEVANTDMLINLMKMRYPSLASSTYMVAVNNTMVTENAIIRPGSKVAFMPPFSGG
ncbi:MAG: MoaD/ThiS family protein [Chitinophagaceae bacterium]|jgi:molybdopterin converting factor subunit 1|nr:MoaD/ThiS family protein [Chitinophagaceae bacterium]